MAIALRDFQGHAASAKPCNGAVIRVLCRASFRSPSFFLRPRLAQLFQDQVMGPKMPDFPQGGGKK
jgi:hypothetical protein